MPRKSKPMQPAIIEYTQPGVYLLAHVFVPWSQILDDTTDEAYVRMSFESFTDMLFDDPEKVHDLKLAGGIVVGRNAS